MNAYEQHWVARLLDTQGHDVTPLAWEEARPVSTPPASTF